MIISSPVVDAPFGVLYRGDYTSETLSLVAIPETRIGLQYVRDSYPNSKCVGCGNGRECVEKLLAGKASSVIMYMPALQRIAAEYGEDLNIKALSSPCGVCFAALPKNAALIGLVNKALPYVNAVTLNEIDDRHAVANSVSVSHWQFFRKHPVYLYCAAIALLALIIAVMLLRRRTAVRYMREIEKALQSAQAANRAKTEFLFNMSHDIRTPMNAITGFTEIARKNAGSPAVVSDCLDKIDSSGTLLLSLINNVLDMSRIESGKMKLNEIEADVFDSFLGVVTIMTEQAKRKGISIDFGFGPVQDRYVYADCDRGTRIFVNLISNAIKYSKPNGYVKVRCEQVVGDSCSGSCSCSGSDSGGDSNTTTTTSNYNYATYRYTFEDNGIGMSEEFQRHLFEQFMREQNSTTSGIQGTGLGLAITRKIVDLMGGSITCRSKQGEGTTFTVELPFRVREGAVADSCSGSGGASGSTTATANRSSFAGKRVLLVEDNELNREVATYVLKEQGLTVDSADDGSVAVSLVKEKGPGYYDYILMDIQMPIMGGYEATRAIRAWEREVVVNSCSCSCSGGASNTTATTSSYNYNRLPIIALSANAFAEDKAASIAAGMDDHVAKPVKTRELMACLARFSDT